MDCAVTGSDEGSPDNPKFSLKLFFEKQIFPQIAKLVGPGGRFAGYKVIFQGDNAGPHQDNTFLKFVELYCATNGWHWEPQAPLFSHACRDVTRI